MYFEKLKIKWGVRSNLQLIVIFIVFAITGSGSVRLGEPLLNYLQLTPDAFGTSFFGSTLYWILRLVVIFPLYQVLLIVVGAVFFQFRFFWDFEKKILKRIGFKFLFKES